MFCGSPRHGRLSCGALPHGATAGLYRFLSVKPEITTDDKFVACYYWHTAIASTNNPMKALNEARRTGIDLAALLGKMRGPPVLHAWNQQLRFEQLAAAEAAMEVEAGPPGPALRLSAWLLPPLLLFMAAPAGLAGECSAASSLGWLWCVSRPNTHLHSRPPAAQA